MRNEERNIDERQTERNNEPGREGSKGFEGEMKERRRGMKKIRGSEGELGQGARTSSGQREGDENKRRRKLGGKISERTELI